MVMLSAKGTEPLCLAWPRFRAAARLRMTGEYLPIRAIYGKSV